MTSRPGRVSREHARPGDPRHSDAHHSHGRHDGRRDDDGRHDDPRHGDGGPGGARHSDLPPQDTGDLPGGDLAAAPPPVDDFASQVLDVVDAIPPGRVMSYGDIAAYLAAGPGPRQVGKVMSRYGGAVAWWRVIHSDGTPAPGHDSRALKHYLAEGTPLRSSRPPVRVDMRRARWPGP